MLINTEKRSQTLLQRGRSGNRFGSSSDIGFVKKFYHAFSVFVGGGWRPHRFVVNSLIEHLINYKALPSAGGVFFIGGC